MNFNEKVYATCDESHGSLSIAHCFPTRDVWIYSHFSMIVNIFPTFFILAQCNATRQVVEMECERFFDLAGYILAPRHTRLGVRTYEQLAMLASNV